MAEFLREHQREVVLLDLQHVKAAPTAEAHAKLLGQIEKHLASLMAPPEVGVNVTYGELVQKGHQAVVFYPFDTADADFPGVGIGAFARRIGCWHRGGGTLKSPWPQARAGGGPLLGGRCRGRPARPDAAASSAVARLAPWRGCCASWAACASRRATRQASSCCRAW